MYIPRDIDAALDRWAAETRRKPLLLRGVRQCGKTSAVKHLARRFENFVEINLEKQLDLHSLFEGDIDIDRIIARFEIVSSERITPGKTLLFIDEIQECPRAITALRYFYEDKPELHVVAAGSLLEITLNQKNRKFDFPVGRIRSMYLYPFSFLEFLRGTGSGILCDYLQNLDYQNEPNDAHSQLIEEYKTFLVAGGMPEAVATYADTKSLYACQQIHRDIVENFKDDFGKYDSDVSPDIIRKVFAFATRNPCAQVRSSSAVPGISSYCFDESVRLLQHAGLVFPVKASPCDTFPFGASEKETGKKLLLFDTGIYLAECGLDANDVLSAKIFDDLNKGALVEMQTGLEMMKYSDPARECSLHYWYRSGANAEVDYVIQKGSAAIPVEVKASGKGRMQSMRSFLATHPKSPYGIRVSLEDFTEFENIRVFPVYAVWKYLQA